MGNKKYIELLNIEGITFIELDKIIKEIITSIEYSPENYIKILEDNKLLKLQLEKKNEINNTTNLILLSSENKKLKIENIKLIKKYNALKKRTKTYNEITDEITDEDENFVFDYDDEYNKLELEKIKKQYEIDNYGIANKIIQPFTKNKNGTYNIDNQIYEKLCSSREDVWNCKAYKTSGGLIKDDLMINPNGKIVSKKKSIIESNLDRFKLYGINK